MKDRSPHESADFAFQIGEPGASGDWLLDSGASRHYAHDRTIFHTYQEVEEALTTADGRPIPIIGRGSIRFVVTDMHGQTRTVDLQSVYHSPALAVNLVSATAISQAGMTIYFENDWATIRKKGRAVARAKLNERRWVMDWQQINESACYASSTATNWETWHRRLCHLGERNMERLTSLVNGFKSIVNTHGKNCADCAVGKLSRRKFKTSTNPRARQPLDLLHMDYLVINIEGRSEERYALILTDDHSGMKFVFPTKTRGGAEILATFKLWLPLAERLSDRKLKALRSDNAKEFTDGVFGNFLRDRGVEHQTTVPYEHEQNGLAERSNRTLLERARTILLESGLDKMFWPDALKTAAYTSNRSPYAELPVTPYEAFSGIKPNLAHLRVFGARCWTKIPVRIYCRT